MMVHDVLASAARKVPDKVALVCGKERLTYGDLRKAAGGFAASLLEGGLERGDRVAICLENSPECVTAVFGALQAGGCVVVVNPASVMLRIQSILLDCTPRFFVCSPERREEFRTGGCEAALPGNIILTGPQFVKACQAPASDVDVPVTGEDLAAIIYTSGSTGLPKGVTHLHRTIDAAVESICGYLGHTEQDTVLSVLPLSSSYGLMQLLVTFRAEGRLILEKGFGFPFEVIQRMVQEGVTGFAGAPTIWALLLKLTGIDPGLLAAVRYITNAAAALPATFLPGLQRLFPNARIFLMHGATEVIRTTFLPPEEIGIRPTSVGRGMSNIELWLEDEDGRHLGRNEVGEMVVRGGSVMVGYWNNPQSTARVLFPGRYPWERVYHTGDLFRTDEEGNYHFVARTDEVIKSRGEKVSPVEIEDVLYKIEHVAEARVIPVPHPVMGHAIRAEIVWRGGGRWSIQQIKGHCKAYLEDFKVPHEVEFVSELPKTQGGKIKRTIEPAKL